MGELRLYRNIYSVDVNSVYTPIDPFFITASTYVSGTGSTRVEGMTPTREALGVYYVDLTPKLYSFDNTYTLQWQVEYLENTPRKNLTTKFRFNPENISGNVSVEILNNMPLNVSVITGNVDIEIE